MRKSIIKMLVLLLVLFLVGVLTSCTSRSGMRQAHAERVINNIDNNKFTDNHIHDHYVIDNMFCIGYDGEGKNLMYRLYRYGKHTTVTTYHYSNVSMEGMYGVIQILMSEYEESYPTPFKYKDTDEE